MQPPSTRPPPLPPTRPEPPRRYRALHRLERWPVGAAFSGETLPERAPCVLLFPDVIGTSVEPFLKLMADEVARNRLLADLPLVGPSHIGLDARQRPFMVLPGALGPDLASFVAERGPLAPLAAVQLALQLADALVRLHYRSRALGSLEPWTVRLPLLRGDPARVVDLGLARGLFDRAVQPPRPGPFTAPGLRAGEPLRPGDDRFAVGALLYFTLTGAPPGPDAPPPSVRVALGPFAAVLDAVVLQALGQREGPLAPTGMTQLARNLRGLRDLLSLSPQARAVVLRERSPVAAPRPSAAPLPPGAVGFVELDGPLFDTQAELPALSVEALDEALEFLPEDALESLGDAALERIRTGALPPLTPR